MDTLFGQRICLIGTLEVWLMELFLLYLRGLAIYHRFNFPVVFLSFLGRE
jgi:hypothetical protein